MLLCVSSHLGGDLRVLRVTKLRTDRAWALLLRHRRVGWPEQCPPRFDAVGALELQFDDRTARHEAYQRLEEVLALVLGLCMQQQTRVKL